MATAQKGNKVKVHYTGKLTDGTVFDSSAGKQPLEFTLGEGMMIRGFEKAVEGLNIGDKTIAQLKPEEAYGDRRENLVFDFPKEKFPEDINPEVGMQLSMSQQDGRQVPVVVTEVEEKSVKLDANHPLAGKELVFEIEMVGIE